MGILHERLQKMVSGVLSDPDVHLQSWVAPRMTEPQQIETPEQIPGGARVADTRDPDLPLGPADAAMHGLAVGATGRFASHQTEDT